MNGTFGKRILSFLFSCLAVCGVARSEPPISNRAIRQIVAERNLLIREVNGTRVLADMYRPADDRRYPVVMMIHGGAWSTGDKWNLTNHAREIALAGFVAVSVNYRLAPKSPISEQIDDCRYALRWVANNSQLWNADMEHFGLWGYSAGAHLSSLIALKPLAGEPKIRAVAAGGAPCEFSFVPKKSRLLVHVMGGTRAELPDQYLEVSPVKYANANAPPFYFYHGTKDLLVPQSSSKALFDRLDALKVNTQYHCVEGQGHLLTFLDIDSRQRVIQFLDTHLKDVP